MHFKSLHFHFISLQSHLYFKASYQCLLHCNAALCQLSRLLLFNYVRFMSKINDADNDDDDDDDSRYNSTCVVCVCSVGCHLVDADGRRTSARRLRQHVRPQQFQARSTYTPTGPDRRRFVYELFRQRAPTAVENRCC